MPIEASTPTVVPATPEKTYDKWWIYSLVIDGSDVNHPSATIVLRKYATDEQGNIEFSPVDPALSLSISDIFAAAAIDTNVASAIGAIYAAVTAMGTAQGAL